MNLAGIMDKILYNYGVTDITPSEHLLLAGYANRKGLSADIHRPLTSRCLVLNHGAVFICLIINDLMDVDPAIVEKIASSVSGMTGLPLSSVIIASIHTHSAPVMEYRHSEANDRYIELAAGRIAENAAAVINNNEGFKRGNIRFGKSRCSINIARRDIKPEDGGMAYRIGDPDGLKDEEVLIMEIADDQGGNKVTMFNYACHPVTLGYGSNYISTDYPGKAREVIENERGGMALFVNGATGDLNPRMDNNTSPENTDLEGEKLGNAVLSAILLPDAGETDLRAAEGVIRVPFRDRNVTKEHIAEEVKRKSSDITEFFTWKEMLQTWAGKVYEMIERGVVKEAFPFKINTVKIGNAVLFITQGELFVKYQIELKKLFPDHHVFCITYAHGTGAYIPTADVFKMKGYEADQAYIYEVLPSPLSPEIETIYLEGAVKAIKTLIS